MRTREILPTDPVERRLIIDGLRYQGWTLQAIGERFGLTRERIRQLSTVPASRVPRVSTAKVTTCEDCGVSIPYQRKRCVDCREERTHHTGSAHYYKRCRCLDCMEANKRRRERFIEGKRPYLNAQGVSEHPLVRHGTVTGYGAYSCRCPECFEAQSRANRVGRERRKAEAR